MDKGEPVPTEIPPQLPVNHSTVVPEPPTDVNEIFPASVEQKLFLSTVADVGAVGEAVTLTTTVAVTVQLLVTVTV